MQVPSKLLRLPKLIPAVLLVSTAAPAATITFESYATGNLGAVNGATTNAPFTGVNGWSLSTSTGPGTVVTTTNSGEYVGGRALQGSTTLNQTYIGGLLGVVELTGYNSISFDAQYTSGIGVGYLGDDGDSLFDQVADTGLAYGVGGSPVRFEARYAGFGTEVFNPASAAGTAGSWYHYDVLIGESVSGSRTIEISVRNLTLGTAVDLNGAAAGTSWLLTVTDAQFGVSPESAVGGFVRITQAGANGAKIDNLRFTAVPEPAATLVGALGLLALLRRRRAA